MQENPDESDIDTAPSPEQRTVFIDCEFTDMVDPELLSIGLVCDDGRELYVELSGAEHLANASTFVLDTVTPQFGLVGYQEMSRIDIGQRVGAWLLGLGEASIAVRFDYRADMVLLEIVLRSAGLWARLSSVIKPVNIGYLVDEPGVMAAMEDSWNTTFATIGIDRHHALADARALRAGYLAIHGVGSSAHLGNLFDC